MRLYVDDERKTPETFDLRTYGYHDTIKALLQKNVTHVSLDHDLGNENDLTGYDIACWIEFQARMGTLPRMTWEVHSMNSSGALRIRQAMTSADRFWNES